MNDDRLSDDERREFDELRNRAKESQRNLISVRRTAKSSGVSFLTAKKALQILEEYGLVQSIDNKWRAIEPGDQHDGWFSKRQDGGRNWPSRLSSYPSLRPIKERLSVRGAALYSLFRSLAKKENGIRVCRDQSDAGLAVMLGMSRKTIADLRQELDEKQLIKVFPNTERPYYSLLVSPLTGERAGLFQSKQQAGTCPELDAAIAQAQKSNSSSANQEYRFKNARSQKVYEVLRNYGIPAELSAKIIDADLTSMDDEQINTFLNECDSLNRDNFTKGKSQHRHSGYLILHRLKQRAAVVQPPPPEPIEESAMNQVDMYDYRAICLRLGGDGLLYSDDYRRVKGLMKAIDGRTKQELPEATFRDYQQAITAWDRRTSKVLNNILEELPEPTLDSFEQAVQGHIEGQAGQ